MGSSRLQGHKSRTGSCLRSLAHEAPAGPKHSLVEGHIICPPGRLDLVWGPTWVACIPLPPSNPSFVVPGASSGLTLRAVCLS